MAIWCQSLAKQTFEISPSLPAEKVRVPVHFGFQMSAVVSCEVCFVFFCITTVRRCVAFPFPTYDCICIYVCTIYIHIYIYISTVALPCFKPSKLPGYGLCLCEEFKIVYKIAVGLPMAVYRQTLNWE